MNYKWKQKQKHQQWQQHQRKPKTKASVETSAIISENISKKKNKNMRDGDSWPGNRKYHKKQQKSEEKASKVYLFMFF